MRVRLFTFGLTCILGLLSQKSTGQGVTEPDTVVLNTGDTMFVSNLERGAGAITFRNSQGSLVFLRLDRVSYASGLNLEKGSESVIPAPQKEKRYYKVLNTERRWFLGVSPFELVSSPNGTGLSGYNNSILTARLEYFPLRILSVYGKLGVGVSPATDNLEKESRYVTYHRDQAGLSRQGGKPLEVFNLDYSIAAGASVTTKSRTSPMQLFLAVDLGFAQARTNTMEIYSYYRTDTINQWGGTEIDWVKDSVIVRQQTAPHFEMGFSFGVTVGLGSKWMLQTGLEINTIHALEEFGAGLYREYRDGVKYGDELIIDYHSTSQVRTILVFSIKRALGRK